MFVTFKITLKKILTICSWNLLDLITICYYKNAFECILKAIDWFYSILLIFLERMF